jgi:hypothetical protein
MISLDWHPPEVSSSMAVVTVVTIQLLLFAKVLALVVCLEFRLKNVF